MIFIIFIYFNVYARNLHMPQSIIIIRNLYDIKQSKISFKTTET